MAKILRDPISLTTHHLHMCFTETDAVLSSGTGFIYRRQGTNYLITNWHNVAGRDPNTGKCLSGTAAIPDMVTTMFRQADQPANCRREHIRLYLDAQMQRPAWYEHPLQGHRVDVVAIPLDGIVQENRRLFPINAIQFDTTCRTEVADEAFVIGYPFSDTPYLHLPIWKRASIASGRRTPARE